MTTTPKWDEARTSELTAIVGTESPVTVPTVEKAAVALGTTVRSIAAKLRKLGFEVNSMAKVTTSAFSADEAEQLANFVTENAGNFTYAEVLY